jgi:hypothetical protein
MTQTTITCDRCDVTIDADRVRLIVDIGTMPGAPHDLATGKPALDLCPTCWADLAEWLRRTRQALIARVGDPEPRSIRDEERNGKADAHG